METEHRGDQSAEEIFRSCLGRYYAGEQVDFGALCAAHPRQAAESRVIKTEFVDRCPPSVMARLCSLHRTYISMLERGLKSPSLNTIAALARALKMPAHELVRATEQLASS